jgi:hypothetical protein
MKRTIRQILEGAAIAGIFLLLVYALITPEPAPAPEFTCEDVEILCLQALQAEAELKGLLTYQMMESINDHIQEVKSY